MSKVFLITGASSGIGEALARRAAEEGHRVVLAARTTERLEAIAADLGDAALPVRCDVRELADLEATVNAGSQHFGAIDVVVANAGLIAARGYRNESAGKWRDLVLTNVLGVAYTVRATLDALTQSRGHLVLIGSASGRRIQSGSLYGATKAAVTAIAEGARLELAGTGVRVTVVEPGTVDTPLYDNPQADALAATDVADTILWATAARGSVDVNEILVRPTAQR